MKYPLLLLLLFLAPFPAHSQNYNCLQHGPIHYFTNGDGYLRGMRIDSVRTSGSDTIYYPYHTMRGFYCFGGALDSTGGSWLGKKVIRQVDGTFLFDNMWNDTVVIKSQAQPGDSWVFFSDTSQKFYTATVTGIDTMTVYGGLDSIKNLKITAYASGVFDPSDSIGNFEIILSKHHGFIQVFDLFTFPYNPPASAPYYMGYIDYYLDLLYGRIPYVTCGGLMGAPMPHQVYSYYSIFRLVYLPNPAMMELHDVSAGDIFEYGTTEYSSGASITKLKADSITTATTSPFHIAYAYTYKERITVSTPGGSTTNYGESGGTFGADTSKFFQLQKLPEERGQHFAYYYRHREPEPCNASYFGHSSIRIDFSTCGVQFEKDESDIYKIGAWEEGFVLGFGRTHYYRSNRTGAGTEETTDLIYVRKNGANCGTYLPVAVNEIQPAIADNVILFPNPAQDILNISSPSLITHITITDLQGRRLLSNEYNSKDVHINTADFPPGMYFVKINGVATRKFVKQ